VIDQRVEIRFNRRVANNTYLIGFNCHQIAARAKPGQFVMLRVGSGYDPLLRRPFSICGVRDELILVLYDVVGRGTRLLRAMVAGDGVSVLGPLGNGFMPRADDRKSLLVAGGIGIAPLLHLAAGMSKERYHLLAGFRSAPAVIDVSATVGTPTDVSLATDDGTAGHHGPITDVLQRHLNEYRPAGTSLVIYACGPKAMLKKVARMSLESEVSCHVSLEAYMACGLGACQGCAVRAAAGERTYCHVCKDGPVFPAYAIDWDQF
jgi:dihydroorotate dehydrogenase electron transfer subunit